MGDEEYTEKDWKLFRKKIGPWQEAYMERLVCEYTQLLTDENKKASEKFWELDKRIRKNKRDTGVIVEMSRSKLVGNVLSLIQEGAITMDDLDDFSDTFKESVTYWYDKWVKRQAILMKNKK